MRQTFRKSSRMREKYILRKIAFGIRCPDGHSGNQNKTVVLLIPGKAFETDSVGSGRLPFPDEFKRFLCIYLRFRIQDLHDHIFVSGVQALVAYKCHDLLRRSQIGLGEIGIMVTNIKSELNGGTEYPGKRIRVLVIFRDAVA